MLSAKITVNLENHGKLRALLDGAESADSQEMLDYWARTYKSFTLLRFDIFAGGGGNWRKVTRETARRKGNTRILEDSREMRLELAEGIGVVDRDELSVTMGFTSEARHSNANLNISELATIHDRGEGVPKRRILVLPNDAVMRTLRGGTAKRMTRIADGRPRK